MATVQQLTSFEAGHADAVHDAAFDHYGRRLATCSSDRLVKVFDVLGDRVTHAADLAGHDGPVWQVAWAHPRFGRLLASAGHDARVVVWKEAPGGGWAQAHVVAAHTASVNAVAWAPHEAGLALAAASSDGSVSVSTYAPDRGAWDTEVIAGAHPPGALAVSWAPAPPAGALVSGAPPGAPERRLATGGADGAVRIWRWDAGAAAAAAQAAAQQASHFGQPGAPSPGGWRPDGAALEGHADWVRDVAWAPNLGLPKCTIASAGQDGRLLAWAERAGGGGWEPALVHDFGGEPVLRLSWSDAGNILAATDARARTSLWREAVDGRWQQLSE